VKASSGTIHFISFYKSKVRINRMNLTSFVLAIMMDIDYTSDGKSTRT